MRPVALATAILLAATPVRPAGAEPDWVGVAHASEAIELTRTGEGITADYTATGDTTGPLPARITITCGLDAGRTIGGAFEPASWVLHATVALTLVPAASLPADMAKDRPLCLVQRLWPRAGDSGEDGNVTAMHLLPGPAAPPFRLGRSLSGKAASPALGPFAPILRLSATTALLDARRYADGIASLHDLALVCDLPTGQAFGLVRHTRWDDHIVSIALQKLSDKRSAKPACMLDASGTLMSATAFEADSRPLFRFNLR